MLLMLLLLGGLLHEGGEGVSKGQPKQEEGEGRREMGQNIK